MPKKHPRAPVSAAAAAEVCREIERALNDTDWAALSPKAAKPVAAFLEGALVFFGEMQELLGILETSGSVPSIEMRQRLQQFLDTHNPHNLKMTRQ